MWSWVGCLRCIFPLSFLNFPSPQSRISRDVKGEHHTHASEKFSDYSTRAENVVQNIFVTNDILCVSFDILGFRHAQTMVFAINEINRNSILLPNVTLGYSLYDNCAALGISFRASLSLASGQEEQFHLNDSCVGSPSVLGIVGDSYSTFTIAISSLIGLYRLPIVSYLIVFFHLASLSGFNVLFLIKLHI